ncbi:pilus assembly protein TadG-related protein [Georgenia sp. AZ-5]|uniref:pilus assembly protein TadG-related protein n=1 Tax=Georgenia sp. AZ-5 TaxID=3367526 RepID=UPI0037546262
MPRLRDERGAVNVVVALLMIPLVGFAAVSVDVAAMWAERQQLQTAADAGALAVAQDCAHGSCGAPATTAQTLATQNVNDGEVQAAVTTPNLTPATGRVTVQTEGVREHWFAPLLGVDRTGITAAATAAWGNPTGGTAMLPLALHRCELQAQIERQGGSLTSASPVLLTILRSKDLKHTDLPADWPCDRTNSGNPVPGGFGWLKTDPGTCRSTSAIADHVQGSDPGNSLPSACETTDIQSLRTATVLLPVYDNWGGQGNNAWFDIVGYAAFTLRGYEFVGHGGDRWGTPCPKSVNTCISGQFVEFVDLSDAFDYGTGAPDLGASVVALTD